MPSNPMQRKAKTSFFLGMLVTLLVCSIIIVILILQIAQLKKTEEVKTTQVCVLATDVKSGETIDASYILKLKTGGLPQVDSNYVPSNAVQQSDLLEGKVVKTDLKAGVILSADMLTSVEEKISNDLRLQEYNMVTLPSQLAIGDYVDIRLMLPTGQDYIVVSKKCVENCDGDSLWVKLTEEEIITMSSAIVETYMMNGANLYATNYVEAGLQVAATPTYQVSSAVGNAMFRNKNILDEAKQALSNRYQSDDRTNIETVLSTYEADEKADNVGTKVTQQITSSREKRQAYIEVLNAATP